MNPYDATFFGLLLLALVPFSWREAWFAYASRSWPTTSVRLHHLGPAVPRIADENPIPSARYSYSVNGVTYESKRWRFGSFLPMRQRDVEHALSSAINPINPLAFYDPDDPGRSCLVPGPNETTLVGPIIHSVLVVILLVLGVRGVLAANR